MGGVTLLINWYVDPDQVRQAELQECLMRNLGNPHIERIIALADDDTPVEHSDKIERVPFNGRPTYTNFFNIGNKYDGVKILSNSGIYFDDSVVYAGEVRPGQVYALCRWDVDAKGRVIFLGNKNSQDVWIWRDRVDVSTGMTLGRLGCDNHIAGLLHQCGYAVLSPSLTIRAHHLHNSGVYHHRPEPIPLPRANLRYYTIDEIERLNIESSIINYHS